MESVCGPQWRTYTRTEKRPLDLGIRRPLAAFKYHFSRDCISTLEVRLQRDEE